MRTAIRRPKVGLDKGDRSWQLETVDESGYLMKVCQTGNPTVVAVGFLPSPTSGNQAYQMSEDDVRLRRRC